MISRQDSRTRADQINREIAAVRAAWGLTPPELQYRDPLWFRSAVFAAIRAGRLPRARAYTSSSIERLRLAGYGDLFDHPAVLIVDGQRIVIAEPYESACHIDRARAMAAELAGILGCESWVSLKSWHYPGRTIRVSFGMGSHP